MLQQFTSKERDVETGLDYFGARYFSSTKGRFTGVDPAVVEYRRTDGVSPVEHRSYILHRLRPYIKSINFTIVFAHRVNQSSYR